MERDWTVPPGEVLAEQMSDRGLSQAQVAELAGVPVPVVDRVLLDLEPISPALAMCFERALGISADFWAGLQREHDAFRERHA